MGEHRWTKADERRAKQLRERPVLTDAERLELREIRRREIREAFLRRRALWRSA